MLEKWQKMPKWFKDTMAVIAPMAILLILYDLLSPQFTHQPYSMTTFIAFPFQVIIAFGLLGLYNHHKIKIIEKDKAQKAEAARIERLKKEQQERQHEENSQRNRAVKQNRPQ
ncbi:MAG TPA: hypothetical protein DDW71_02170 [Lactobacillus sp.]|uniref:Uncharacterized protein n=1 Tax=Secundilactobacillus silagincola TaxID=1714681 RepID=A0A1Z5H4R1_9LACO|nr:hypothetical protein [Secundilactobacillus silagincola]GAT18303.1 hypothetical protein IWT5_00577 [Secundilactobacillus silagincola]HBF74050.1 hypothetical protein [Lactobacillus sp.]